MDDKAIGEIKALFEQVLGVMAKGASGEAGKEGGKEGESGSVDVQIGRKQTIKELHQQAAAQIEVNMLEAKHNMYIRDKEAVRQNLRNIDKEMLKFIAEKEAARQEENQAAFEAAERQLAALQENREELENYAGSWEKLTPAQQKAYDTGRNVATGIAGSIGMMSDASQGHFGRILEGISNISGEGGMGKFMEAFGKTFNVVNLVNNAVQTIVVESLRMATAIEGANAALARTTGQGRRFASEVEGVALASTNLGVTAEGVGKAYGELVEGTANFNSLTANQRQEIAGTAAQLERFGVSLGDSANTMDLFNNALGMGAGESMNLTKNVAMMGTKIGVSAGKMSKDFNAALGTLAVYGKQSVQVFTGIAAAAKAAGVEASELLGIAGKFETFSEAAETTGKLNAILGSNLSTTQLLTMSEDQRIETLIMSVQASGMAFREMDKFTQKAVAATVGITDMSKANKIFGMSVSKYRQHASTMANTAASQEEMNKKLADAMTIAEKVKGAFASLAIGLEPIISFLSEAITVVGEFLQKNKTLVQVLAGVAATTMILVKVVKTFSTVMTVLGAKSAASAPGIAAAGAAKAGAITAVGTATAIAIAEVGAAALATNVVGLILAVVIISVAVALTAVAISTALVVGHLVELIKAMLQAPDAILPMVAGMAAFMGMMMIMGTPLGQLAMGGMIALAVGITAIGIALHFIPVDILKEVASIMESLTLIQFENLEASITGVVSTIQALKEELGGVDDKTVAVTSMIENLALISTGTASLNATSNVIAAATGLQDIKLENLFQPKMEVTVEIEGTPLKTYIKNTVYEVQGDKG